MVAGGDKLVTLWAQNDGRILNVGWKYGRHYICRLGSNVAVIVSTPWSIKNFVKNQLILMQFSLLDLQMNETCNGMNFT